jgi:hypothetical protein
MTEKKEYYRTIIGQWVLLAGIEPFEEFCREQCAKLIGMYPADKEIIMEVYREVWD